jgi:hypothetical protein
MTSSPMNFKQVLGQRQDYTSTNTQHGEANEENSWWNRWGGRLSYITSSSSSCKGVYKWEWPMGQSYRSVHDHNIDELIPALLVPQEVSKWGQPMGRTNSNIHQFTGNMTDKGQNAASYIKTWLYTVFVCCSLQLLSLQWWQRSIKTTNNTWTSLTTYLLQYLKSVNLKCFCSGSCYSNGTWHVMNWKTTSQLLLFASLWQNSETWHFPSHS